MIPKQIFKIWISDTDIPAKFKKHTDTWNVNNGFNIIDVTQHKVNEKVIGVNLTNFYPCNRILFKDSPFLEYAVKNNAPTLINHYLRCYLLYSFGGVYFDLDISCNKSVEPLLNEPLTLGIEDAYVVNNAVIISEPKHEFLKECMDRMDNFKFNKKQIELETGPRLFTNVAKYYGWSFGLFGWFNKNRIHITPPKYFYPYHYTKAFTKECVTKDTYTIHHWASSWNEKVSIVIPCYKQAQYLSDAIESALSQTYTNIEVIVVNDGSPDNTSSIAKKYPKVKLVEKPNGGLSSARNAGVKASTGSWILPLDADDKIHPEYIQRAIGKSDIVSCYLKCFGSSNAIWKPEMSNPTVKDLLTKNELFCCSLFRKEVWEDCGGYDEFMKEGYEDWEFWTHAAKLGYKITILPEILFYYRKHGHSMITDAIKKHKQLHNYIVTKHATIH